MKLLLLLGWGMGFALNAGAAEKKEVAFGAFLDTYYAFDFNQPTGDRVYTTQAVRHNEFSINLAYLEAKLERERTRGRLALQAGSSVYSNYAGERSVNPALGDILQHVQEAYGGYRLTDQLWLDAGIFLSHIGAESFLSKDNWNYTRSLGADYSPYYQAGVRLAYQASPQWQASLHILNGWQNILETNSDKALGMQVIFTPSETFSVTYNNFLGREQELRFFHDVIVKATLSDRWALSFSSDLGMQKQAGGSDYSLWYVETLLSQLRIAPTLTIGGRVEYFHDRDQVIVVTGSRNGFQTFGASLNLDWQPEPGVLFRNEIRSLFSQDAVFSGASGPRSSNTLFVTSLALAI